jgi:hypothetical protein
MTPTEVLVDIERSIRRLIEAGLSVQQNWPTLKPTAGHGEEIGITGSPNLSVSLRDVPYWEIYQQLQEARAFHIQMIDGTLVQMLYRFERKSIVSHRLCAFPSPRLEPYDNEPRSYDDDEIYADIIGKNIVHFPIRFDYSSSLHRDVDHPMSHLTLGQYLNCRIPVNAPLTPTRFLHFFLRNFYYNAFHAHSLSTLGGNKVFGDTITTKERGIGHFVC